MALSNFIATWVLVFVLGISAVHYRNASNENIKNGNHEDSRRLRQHEGNKYEEPKKEYNICGLQFNAVNA